MLKQPFEVTRTVRLMRAGAFDRIAIPSRYALPAAQFTPDAPLVRILVEAVCHDCRHRHRIDCQPWQFPAAMSEWERKHRGHNFEFISLRRDIPKGFDDRTVEQAGRGPWWLDYKHNADIKIAYAADAAFTITLASLATSSTWVAGRESTSVSNTTNKYLDYDVTGKITTGTTPTVDTEIRMYGIRPIEDTPTWPDVFDGTDSAETVTNTQILATLPLLWSGTVSATSNIAYQIINGLTLAQCWGIVPDNFEIFVAHNTAVNLNATGGNHDIRYRGIYATST
jgi:hypothetical protein